ncbi:MAG: hypothetical protein IKQ72_06790 [Bacteroidaceae bacterium]|jgi:hypothetical protein|nr:hypothetical protein [Bacteroidaceae bacterium]MBR6197292.1 hypothetical protein [Bacteroidaceae bacterium]
MANIKNLQMWNDICRDVRVHISKSFFGFYTTATYIPTDSIIDAHTIEYTPTDGERLRHIMFSPRAILSDVIGDYHPKPTVNGNYMMEVCCSRDWNFVALQLHQYLRLNYEPVTETLIFEGEEARIISRLFK